MGRSTDCTPIVQKAICDGILAGLHLEVAAPACGVPADTAQEWRRRGEGRAKNRPANATYATFALAVRQAEAQCERGLVTYWRAQVPDNWQAARDMLARRFPDRWANREKVDVGGTGKEIVFRVTYGDSAERPAGVDGPATPTAPEAGSLPG